MACGAGGVLQKLQRIPPAELGLGFAGCGVVPVLDQEGLVRWLVQDIDALIEVAGKESFRAGLIGKARDVVRAKLTPRISELVPPR